MQNCPNLQSLEFSILLCLSCVLMMSFLSLGPNSSSFFFPLSSTSYPTFHVTFSDLYFLAFLKVAFSMEILYTLLLVLATKKDLLKFCSLKNRLHRAIRI